MALTRLSHSNAWPGTASIHINKKFREELIIYFPLIRHGLHGKRNHWGRMRRETAKLSHKPHKPKQLGGIQRQTTWSSHKLPSIFTLLSLFWKSIRRFMRSPCCLCVPPNFLDQLAHRLSVCPSSLLYSGPSVISPPPPPHAQCFVLYEVRVLSKESKAIGPPRPSFSKIREVGWCMCEYRNFRSISLAKELA
jgi:hypothetical protein